jgi:hypothetical protein
MCSSLAVCTELGQLACNIVGFDPSCCPLHQSYSILESPHAEYTPIGCEGNGARKAAVRGCDVKVRPPCFEYFMALEVDGLQMPKKRTGARAIQAFQSLIRPLPRDQIKSTPRAATAFPSFDPELHSAKKKYNLERLTQCPSFQGQDVLSSSSFHPMD